ncbi:MAG: L-threonylcarbamoyladenylate synthase [Polaribacter sp.]
MDKELLNSLKFLQKGKIILYPTDTVWGLGCDATNEISVAKIYQLKNRVESKSLIVLVSSVYMLKKYVSVPKVALEILQTSTNPTTIIYENPKGFSKNMITADKTIAIRIVKDEFCRKLIKQFGKPIVSTSANVSGKATAKSFREISKSILRGVDYVVKLNQEKKSNKASTIIKIKNGKMEILRA